MEDKVCKDCKEEKSISSFYGKQGECKTCTKKRVKRKQLLNRLDPKWVEKERKRGRDKYYRLNYKNKRLSKETRKKKDLNYRTKYPEKYKAKISSQRIEVPNGFERHHWSYLEEYQKDIIPLSTKDHNLLHRYLVYNQGHMMYEDLEGNLLDTRESHIEYYLKIKTDYANKDK